MMFAAAISLFCLVASTLPAQTLGSFEVVTDHYRVSSEVSDQDARETAERMEAMLELFNSYFRFEVDELKQRLSIRILSTKARFDDYLTRIIGGTRDEFVYLHYSDPAKNELVGFPMPEPAFSASLNRQALVQFFRAFVQNPPLWLREGFAVYFEKATYDRTAKKVVMRENLAWLETLQAQAKTGLLPWRMVLSMDLERARSTINSFYPQAWGMVAYFLDPTYDAPERILWDSLSALSPDATLEQNVDRVYRRAFRWYEEADLVKDFAAYLDFKKSFSALVREGIDLYSRGVPEYAEDNFIRAAELEPENYIPHYYLGLIEYDRRNYLDARRYFDAALERKAPGGLVLYAMGVNAFAADKIDEAAAFLVRSKDTDPAFREKADDILRRMGR